MEGGWGISGRKGKDACGKVLRKRMGCGRVGLVRMLRGLLLLVCLLLLNAIINMVLYRKRSVSDVGGVRS